MHCLSNKFYKNRDYFCHSLDICTFPAICLLCPLSQSAHIRIGICRHRALRFWHISACHLHPESLESLESVSHEVSIWSITIFTRKISQAENLYALRRYMHKWLARSGYSLHIMEKHASIFHRVDDRQNGTMSTIYKKRECRRSIPKVIAVLYHRAKQ